MKKYGSYYFRAWRVYRDLTQTKVSEMTGISVSMVTRIERGEVGYSPSTLERLAAAYDCTPADLLGVDPLSTAQPAPAHEPETTTDLIDDGGRGQLPFLMDALPNEDIPQVVQFLKALVTIRRMTDFGDMANVAAASLPPKRYQEPPQAERQRPGRPRKYASGAKKLQGPGRPMKPLDDS